MAKFKIGDKVTSKSRRYLGEAKIIDKVEDGYIVKFNNGMRDMLEEDDVVAANACRNAVVANALRARNEIGDLNFDMNGVYQTARKLLAAGAKHVGGYRWSIPGDMQYGAKVIAEKVGGTVRQVSPDKDRAGFVVVEITDPLAQALERRGIMNARNAMRDNGDVLVEFTTLGASGMERVSKRMTSTAFRDWLVKTGNGAHEQGIWNELMKGDNASFLHGGIKVSVKAL